MLQNSIEEDEDLEVGEASNQSLASLLEEFSGNYEGTHFVHSVCVCARAWV